MRLGCKHLLMGSAPAKINRPSSLLGSFLLHKFSVLRPRDYPQASHLCGRQADGPCQNHGGSPIFLVQSIRALKARPWTRDEDVSICELGRCLADHIS
ncbi:hypothetical protein IAQ61_010673 [Plenodomus lingam]|uniref:uncharacterized protein n=1 Tax=Leptosphaeria maculans TaxID=5022 RepID=UPI003320A8AB|nr:hypothetical protein IAQ61_010673 [Plenodomus lingam]